MRDQNHLNDQIQEQQNIGPLNGTDSQENPMNNNRSNNIILAETNRKIGSNRHRGEIKRLWIHGKSKKKMGSRISRGNTL